jgi:hypothetical protein
LRGKRRLSGNAVGVRKKRDVNKNKRRRNNFEKESLQMTNGAHKYKDKDRGGKKKIAKKKLAKKKAIKKKKK